MLGLRSLLNEDDKQKSIVHNRSGSQTEFVAIVELVEIQDKIEKMNEGLINRILEIEHDSSERCKPLYHSRNQITKNIPHFWRIVFSRHPVIQYYQLSEDLQIFNHLTSLEVEEFKDGKSGYSITLNFDPNPYFEDKELTKTFTWLDERTMEITATRIKWKKEKVGYVSEVKKKQKMRPMVNQSFFVWFSLVEEKEIFEDFEDEIADSIKEDIWPNPLAYFVSTKVPLSAINLDGDIVDDKKVTEEREVENEHYAVSFERILKIEGDILKIKKKAKNHVLEVEKVHNEVCKEFYYKRRDIIKTIPDFWQIAFLSHPVLTTFIREEDEKIFKHLTSLEVEGIITDDVKFSYMISLNFEPNEYFENTKLSKTYTFVGKESKVNATPVDWKNKEVRNVAYQKLSPGSDVRLVIMILIACFRKKSFGWKILAEQNHCLNDLQTEKCSSCFKQGQVLHKVSKKMGV